MPLNISYYRMNGQIKAFPKFNNKIHALGKNKVKALEALRAKSDFIIWLQDQYVTGEITKEYLADMLGIRHHSIDCYISKKNLILKKSNEVEQFYPNTTQDIIIRRLQQGGHIRQDKQGDFYLMNVLDKSTKIAKERYCDVEELINDGYIVRDSNVTEHRYNPISNSYDKIKYSTHVIAIKGVTLFRQLQSIH